jgi:DNA-binding MarR family transcriptional regulator
MRLISEASDVAPVVVETSITSGPSVFSRAALLDAAQQELEWRRRRNKVLPEEMFGEPAWEILLQLYVEQQGTRLNIARLTSYLNLSASTVLRWLNYLHDKQLLRRESHPTDQRSVFVELTTGAVEVIDSYFSEVLTRPT